VVQINVLVQETVFHPQGTPSPFLPLTLQISLFRSKNSIFLFWDIRHEEETNYIHWRI